MANNITRWTGTDFPNTLLAIDPGAALKRKKKDSEDPPPYVGAALFQWGFLVWASMVSCPIFVDTQRVPAYSRTNQLVRSVCAAAGVARTVEHTGEPVQVLAVEQPILYTRSKARPRDIIALRQTYGAFMGGIDAEMYSGPTAQEWRGSAEGKEHIHERLLRILNAAERDIVARGATDGKVTDHALDAVGLGLFVLGRAGTAMVV